MAWTADEQLRRYMVKGGVIMQPWLTMVDQVVVVLACVAR